MINYHTKHLTVVVYDGITNSVFQSQVLQPILDELNQDTNLQVTFVCFEKPMPTFDVISKVFGEPERLKAIFFPRKSFFGKLSLRPAIQTFKKFIKNHECDQIIARGPLAGYVVLQSLKKTKKMHIPVTIQARGLCAQEYRYTNKDVTNNPIKRLWNKFIFSSLNKIEHEVYGTRTTNLFDLKIEAVSQALKDYLIQEFGANPVKITIATKDIPKSIDKHQAVVWRGQVRDELGIPDDATVYCYSGSFKPWQCAKETIESFSFQYFKDKNSVMLVLTQDQEPFKKELERLKIPATNYRVMSVKPQELYKYLCAANFGFLLREPDIINWVSRPTKMLEYQACGLQTIHNNTVAWLVK